MHDWQSLSHVRWECKYHVVVIPKGTIATQVQYAEFKQEAVALSRQPGVTVKRAAADLDVPENTLHRWRRELAQDGADAFRGNGRLAARGGGAGPASAGERRTADRA